MICINFVYNHKFFIFIVYMIHIDNIKLYEYMMHEKDMSSLWILITFVYNHIFYMYYAYDRCWIKWICDAWETTRRTQKTHEKDANICDVYLRLFITFARDHQPRCLRRAVPVADGEAERVHEVEHRNRGQCSDRENLDQAGEWAAGGVRGVGEHVEDHRPAAHVGDRMGGGVEAAEADVDAVSCSYAPGEAPPVGVEHGERPQPPVVLRHQPIDEGVHDDQEEVAVAVDNSLGGWGGA